MVVHFLRFYGYSCHKGEGFAEVFELKFFIKLIFFFFPHKKNLKYKMFFVLYFFVGQLKY